jgi:rhodanese-related sulfurtransferase
MTVPALPPAAVGDRYLVDVREHDEWAAGHAPTATHLPMSEIQARLAEVPVDLPVAIVCRVGARSAQVVDWLQRQGYDAVNVEGGMLRWQYEGLPVEGDVL